MRGNHSAGEEEQRRKKKRKNTRESRGRGWRGERKRGEEETVIISSLSCESQPVLRSLPGKLEMRANCLYSESVLPDSAAITKQRPFWFIIVMLSKEQPPLSAFIYQCFQWPNIILTV